MMQGWFLFNDMNFWQPPQAEAFLTAIPTSNLLMLDLVCTNKTKKKKIDKIKYKQI